MDGQPVKDEVTFERGMGLLLRHREWGFNVPAVDIDFLEYDNKKAIALVEYKRSGDPATSKINLNEANIQALIDLGSRASVPIFCTFYSRNLKRYRVFPLNNIAVRRAPPEGLLTERKYVDFLYRLRGRGVPDWIKL